MIGKILLTLSVIVLAWLVVRNRQRRMALMTARPPAAKPAVPSSGSWRVGVYLFVAAMILVSGVLIYQRWQDGDQVVTVRVVDTQSGRSVTYQARRNEVEERHFVTLDGREVSVAETERIEVERSDDRR
jgi:hypothetical protein